MTGFLRFFVVPVRGSCILKPSRTGPVRGPSKKGNRTETGPDFKALLAAAAAAVTMKSSGGISSNNNDAAAAAAATSRRHEVCLFFLVFFSLYLL